MWIMMIAGFSSSAGIAGHFLQPYSAARLVQVYALASAAALALACLAIWRVEGSRAPVARRAVIEGAAARGRGGLRNALAQVWSDPAARRFTVFLFTAMLAFSAQELLLEPFAGLVFGYAPGRSAGLAGIQNAGVLTGMLLLVMAALGRGQAAARRARHWMVAGTIGSAAGVIMLAAVAALGRPQALPAAAFLLGLANGVFAVAALGVMMELSAAGGRGREGLRMGLWGAAQALAFAAGGLSAGAAVDVLRHLGGSAGGAYSAVFCVDGGLFLAASWCALRLNAGVSNDGLRPRLGADAGVVA